MLKENTELSDIIAFFEIERWDEVSQDFKLLENEQGIFKTLYIHDAAGLTIREYSSAYKEDYAWNYTVTNSNQIEISFFFNEEPIHDTIDGQLNEYLPYHNYIYYTPNEAKVEIHFPQGKRYQHLDMYVPLNYFEEWIDSHPEVAIFQRKIYAQQFARLFPSGLPITVEALTILLAIKTCTLTGIVRDFFMKAKTLELLTVLFEASKEQQEHAKPNQAIRLRQTDIAILKAIKDFIELDTEHFHTIDYLSKKFNINVFKLKKGFKEAYGVGVFEYASQIRMDKALKLIHTSEYSVKEIAFRIGYSTVSSFSSAFKKVHGVSPNKLRL